MCNQTDARETAEYFIRETLNNAINLVDPDIAHALYVSVFMTLGDTFAELEGILDRESDGFGPAIRDMLVALLDRNRKRCYAAVQKYIDDAKQAVAGLNFGGE